ncbi:MAG: preprotein translocase subunit SecY [Parcubacteria group bacterium CG_4_9_14_0_2_um_filter_41_8]|nr:MAG: preprotein translocase subunit SecY [Parcubacteria group bacterium CG1_02_41_12]PIP67445.1 MAG: preprotein translocase subunit SecY [Parcubacteria group bacterium CG22_combo_CG10-13_8_21_14_all_41_9]PIQ79388.1 MAG: preprotein translocase subunit SecY [Parcubacteria group bacterium CG11_big_fil_rev_8_21_14_0_20_41_14]PIR57528.1 MAG: preprotein translocase subunit SecY [Parcubacteria group bacterium CG10_big_fil_rev_8_21_14_0_10_41_35]PJC40327.1 MAG: preprotein translocase subunit SecY [P
MVIQKIKQIWHTKDIRNDILFVLLVFIIFRTLAHIPVPGVDVTGLQAFFNSNQVLGLLNILTGGGLENFSVVMLGVGPYITSSIIFQLLGMIIPKLEEMQKESEQGRQKINQWTRLATVPLAFIQSYGTISFLQRAGGTGGADLIGNIPALQMAITMMIVTAGTVFLMWLGELMSERRVGNGVSLLIFAGIVSGLPTVLLRVFSTYDSSQLINVILFLIIAVVTVAGVVFITEGQRNIPVTYAKFARGNSMASGGVHSHLPMRVNQAGVIPIIFAISIVLFPPMIAQFFAQSTVAFLREASTFVIQLFNNQLFYGITYFLLVFGFTYFYTAVIFKPDQIAENLQRQGGFIPGIRPGSETAHYLSNVSTRILFAGALFLGIIAIMPLLLQNFTGTNLVIGGTSLLIVVSVVIETVKQVNSQLIMRDYEKF